MSLFAESEIVIIGGGAIGCGVAYSLARGEARHPADRARGGRRPGHHRAGRRLCGQVRSSVERVRLAMHSVDTFGELQRDPDPEARPDWHEVGSIRIALSFPRVKELGRLQALCEQAGLEVAPIDRAEAKRLWRPLYFSAVQAVLWCPSDGYVAPSAVTKGYERQGRRRARRDSRLPAHVPKRSHRDPYRATQTQAFWLREGCE